MPKMIERKLDTNKKVYMAEELYAAGYSRYIIGQMVDDGMLKRISCNAFENMKYEGPESDLYFVPALIPGGIVCLISAAVYYGLSTDWPQVVDVAVKKNRKITHEPTYPSVQIHHFGGDRYGLGRVTVQEAGNTFEIYDIEKTVADILYFRNQVGIEETKEVLVNYLQRRDRNLLKLHEYAIKLGCDRILRTYLEVLVS